MNPHVLHDELAVWILGVQSQHCSHSTLSSPIAQSMPAPVKPQVLKACLTRAYSAGASGAVKRREWYSGGVKDSPDTRGTKHLSSFHVR